MHQSGAGRPLALVTGASSGIGRALAETFVAHGHDVVLAAENTGVHDVAAALSGDSARVVVVQVDLATPEGVEHLHQVVREQGRPLALAALNAGIGVGGEFVETSLEDDLRLVDLNCRSTVHLAKLLARDMVATGEGRLLFTSSIAAVAPAPYQATYAASKAFVQSFALGIRHELKGTGVTVTALMPGPTDTDFFARAGMESTRLAQGRKDDPGVVAEEAYRALVAGKERVITGALANSVQVVAGSLTPGNLAAAGLAHLTKPGTGKERVQADEEGSAT
jgi:short-subunit dehydrogenase